MTSQSHEVSANGTPAASSTGTPSVNAVQSSIVPNATLKKGNVSKRIEVETLTTDLQNKLGSQWDLYQTTITSFLVGKLSRKELTNVLTDLLTDSKMVRMHNQILLANLANSLRDGPNAASAKSGFGANTSNKKRKDGRVKASTQYEKLKKDIMALPIRERHRIKTITRESGKQKMANSALTLTRQALLPKIPYVTDKERAVPGNTVEWTQDITHGLQALLSTESYSLPDNENLKTRMLGIAREHGLTGSIQKEALQVAYLGLETYLRNIIESGIDTVKYRRVRHTMSDGIEDLQISSKRQKKTTLTSEDMVDTFNIFPFLVEPSGPLLKLNSLQLNDDSYVEQKSSTEAFLKPRNKDSILEKISTNSKTEQHKNPQQKKQEQNPLKAIENSEPRLENSESEIERNAPVSETEPLQQFSNGDIPDNHAVNLAQSNVGSLDELNWLIHDIISA